MYGFLLSKPNSFHSSHTHLCKSWVVSKDLLMRIVLWRTCNLLVRSPKFSKTVFKRCFQVVLSAAFCEYCSQSNAFKHCVNNLRVQENGDNLRQKTEGGMESLIYIRVKKCYLCLIEHSNYSHISPVGLNLPQDLCELPVLLLEVRRIRPTLVLGICVIVNRRSFNYRINHIERL